MYEIYAYPYGNPDAKLLLYRPNDPQALVLSPKLTREVSKGGSLVFTMTRDHAQYDMLQKLSTVVQVQRDGKEIWRGRVLKHEADFYNRRVVYCEGALSYFNDSSITPFNYKGTLRQFLQHLIDAHNDQVKSKMKCFQLGTVTAALGNLVVQFGDADQYGVGEDYGKVWDILDKLVLKVFGGYFYCGFDAATGYNVLNYCDQAVEAKRQTLSATSTRWTPPSGTTSSCGGGTPPRISTRNVGASWKQMPLLLRSICLHRATPTTWKRAGSRTMQPCRSSASSPAL